jgi:signal transduction histidine kinase
MLSGFLFLTLLIVCVAIVSLYILNKINGIAAIHGKLGQLEIATLSLIKTDNDFFDLETINPKYFETHESALLSKRDSFKRSIQSGVEFIYRESKNGVIESLSPIDSLFKLYDDKFGQLEKLIFKIGFKDYGLEGEMRFHAHKLEQRSLGMNMLDVLTLRRNEKDFLLRHDIGYAYSLNNLVSSIVRDFNKNPEKNKEILVHLKEYQRIFNALAEMHIQIGLSSKDGLRNELNQLSTELSERYFVLSQYSYKVSNEAQARAKVFYISIVLGAIFFSVFSGYWISKQLSSPIAKLSNLMNHVMSDRKEVKVDLVLNNAAEEINTLTRSFIHLMSQTNGQMKEIKLKSLQIRKRNKDLKKLNSELDGFLYSTAHDLRSPLSSLLGLLHIMTHENKQEDLKQYIEMMEGSIHRMEDFIGQIVGYSKNKRLDIVVEKIDPYILISEVFESHRFVDGANKIDRLVEVKDKFPLCSDRGRMMILMNNLISNAIRYADLNKPHPFIKINVSVEEHEMTIEFSDNGIGIAQEHLDKVFNMFYRANVKSKGSGLGLFIFKETITKLKGRVSIESTLGEGTKFFIWLPNHYSTHSVQMEMELNTSAGDDLRIGT